ncbi:hypothetical protein GQ55_2G202800 [Panicum hallii var. hallii]|uniref:Uncharacterized protein n=1 Tax=Panicum hallii var. hallii TaxID=1504633 RepID=A0A2T7EQP9_9POAL|nr:hypothetical protein GQ55_2G202800 [Panicum hallii var. hallii]
MYGRDRKRCLPCAGEWRPRRGRWRSSTAPRCDKTKLGMEIGRRSMPCRCRARPSGPSAPALPLECSGAAHGA